MFFTGAMERTDRNVPNELSDQERVELIRESYHDVNGSLIRADNALRAANQSVIAAGDATIVLADALDNLRQHLRDLYSLAGLKPAEPQPAGSQAEDPPPPAAAVAPGKTPTNLN